MKRKIVTERYWRIRGYESTIVIFENIVPYGQITTGQMRDLLRALAAKEGLSYEEVVGAYAKRGTRIANDLLHVHRDGPYQHFWCGHDPYFEACLADEEGTPCRPILK